MYFCAVSRYLGLRKESSHPEDQVKLLEIQSSPRGESSDSVTLTKPLIGDLYLDEDIFRQPSSPPQGEQ